MSDERSLVTRENVVGALRKAGAVFMAVLCFIGRILRGAARIAVPVCGFVFLLMIKCISAMAPRR